MSKLVFTFIFNVTDATNNEVKYILLKRSNFIHGITNEYKKIYISFRLPLLADAILSKLPVEHNDRSHWEQVLSSLNYVVAECNEGARAAAKEIEMENLAK